MDLIKNSQDFQEKLDKTKQLLSELRLKKSMKDKIVFCNENFEKLGSGSSRLVYKLPDNTVIKVAKNKKGIEQNKTESSPKAKSPSINRLLHFEPNHSFIRVGLVSEISKEEFQKLFGFDFEDFRASLKFALKNLTKKKVATPDKKLFSKISVKPFFKGLVQIANDLKLVPGDLLKISSYGKKSDRIVLIDYGLSRDIYDKYYKKPSP